MIKKLRKKLIAVSMLSLFLVLLVIMGIVNVLNYCQIVSQADTTLQILAENDGKFPRKEMQQPPEEPSSFSHGALSAELPYESRYFSVLFTGDGSVSSVDTGKIAAVDTQSAVDLAQAVLAGNRQKGFTQGYRYVLQTDAQGTRVIFLDCGRSLSTFYTFLLGSCGISALGLLAVFVLIILFSGRLIRPVSQSYAKQKQFITNAGHELKTPLTGIQADAAVLEMELGQNEWLQDIQAQTKRLSSLANDLILLSRMEEDQPQLCMIDFPLSDLAEETAQSFQLLAKAQNKSFVVEVQPLLTVCGDENTLRQLLSVLLDNALKYSPPGGAVRLQLQKQGRSAALIVENTVAQMPQGDLNKLFDRFYRGDLSHNSQTGGYGLGLPIAAAIVKAHRGRIAASKEGGRLRIKVLLPERQPNSGKK